MPGARSIGRTVFPLNALIALQNKKVLPVLKQEPGFNIAYQIPSLEFGSQQSAETFFVKQATTTGIPIVKTVKEPDLSPLDLLTKVVGFGASIIGSSGTALAGYAASGAQATPLEKGLTIGRGGLNMGLFDDLWGAATGPGGIFNANNGVNWGNLLNTGASIAQQAFAPQPTSFPIGGGGGGGSAIPAMASVPAIAGRVGAVVGRGFFSRFPNLATGIQTLRNGGVSASRSKLYSVMKRFGPEFLVTGGLLTAAAVNELAVAGPGYRRMNPANSRALRRAARRIESFHRLCRHTDMLQSRRRRSSKKC